MNVRKLFRKKIQDALEEKYKFYAMTPKKGVRYEEYLREHFQELLGKVYAPYEQYGDIYSLALDKGENYQKENNLLLKQLKDYFLVEECKLGQDPQEVLQR